MLKIGKSVLYRTTPYYTVLYCTILYYTIPYYTTNTINYYKNYTIDFMFRACLQ